MSSEAVMKQVYECGGCGARFALGEVQPIFQCSLTHREPFRGAGHYIDCPKCGNFEGVKDLRMPPPIASPDKGTQGLPPILFDNESITVQPPMSTIFHFPYVKERRRCGHEHHPKDGPCEPLSSVPASRAPGEEPIPPGYQCGRCGERRFHREGCERPRSLVEAKD